MTDTVVEWGEAPLTVAIALDDDRPRLVRFGPPGSAVPLEVALPPVELEFHGAAKGRGSRHVEQAASARLRYAGHDASEERLELRLTDPETGLLVVQTWRRRAAVPVLQCHAEVRNHGTAPVTLRYVSSLVVAGLGGSAPGPHWTERLRLSYASMDTCAEFQWRTQTPAELGIVDVGIAGSTRRRIALTSLGSTPSGEYLPAGAVTDTVGGTTWAWQIEHNGAWHWEVGDHRDHGYLAVSGPADQEHQWRQVLRPGEVFRTVPVAVAVGDDLTGAISSLTEHRRAIRRPHPDTVELPVVFNDYLNCLWADPTEEKLLPIVDAAAKAGCEVFCVDAGWYSDEPSWWSSVGEWEPSARRFPNGLSSVLGRIAALGMTPGLWLEPEVVGVDSPVAASLPHEAFFQRDGHRVDERGRYQLDLRHPAARAHLDAVVDRLVSEYGVGFLKFDYNINIGTGTDVDADGPGAGLLGHNRAWLRWVEDLLDRHPGLVIESCAGGGARLDYATLAVHTLQSTSDQADHLRTVPIAAAAASAVAPEQAGVWVSPRPELTLDETHLCVVNGLLGRMHVSGRPDLLSDEQFEAVAAGIAVYRSLRGLIRSGRPLWPLGLPGWTDDLVSYGLVAGAETLLAVWRRGAVGPASVELPLPHLRGRPVTVECAYPAGADVGLRWDGDGGVLTVTLPAAPVARLLRLSDLVGGSG
ncbi:alpha-galactosidase [Jiangella mangrovi]|uniref:Alpha-galactosidase n=1 Tax=Jiangella mangrovi TaxID=1524084 RepID=A0A7W9LPD5_9ACTN|nr:alpha-galactosidase [Jiangella mangrovi]